MASFPVVDRTVEFRVVPSSRQDERVRPAFVLIAPEEAGVVAVQAPVGAVRRAGRQVAVADREGRSHREAVAEVRVHAYRASPGGELVVAFIATGVEFGVGARAFHPHVEAGRSSLT